MVAENNHSEGYPASMGPSQPPLRLPRMSVHDTITAAVPRKVYANAHAYHINSISVNSDQETYISADDLRINLWNLNISDQSFSELQRVSRRPRATADAVQTLSTSSLSTWRSSQRSSLPPSSTPSTATCSCTRAQRARSSWQTCVNRHCVTSTQSVSHLGFTFFGRAIR